MQVHLIKFNKMRTFGLQYINGEEDEERKYLLITGGLR